jgi:hypothetical protein
MEEEIVEYLLENDCSVGYIMAKLVKKLYDREYCVLIVDRRETWYKREGEVWRIYPQTLHELNIKLSEEFTNYCSKARGMIRNRIGRLSNIERVIDEMKMKKLFKLEQLLYTPSFKKSVINECESLFVREEFPNNK